MTQEEAVSFIENAYQSVVKVNERRSAYSSDMMYCAQIEK